MDLENGQPLLVYLFFGIALRITHDF